jgi:predicted RNase H-like HicB family nuclease
MENKYTYRIEWSEKDQAYIGTCLEFPGLSSQEATQEEALAEVKVAVAGAAKWASERDLKTLVKK